MALARSWKQIFDPADRLIGDLLEDAVNIEFGGETVELGWAAEESVAASASTRSVRSVFLPWPLQTASDQNSLAESPPAHAPTCTDDGSLSLSQLCS